MLWVGDPRRPYPLDIEMRSGLLGKMQERHVPGAQTLEESSRTNRTAENDENSPSLTQNGHQAVPGKYIISQAYYIIPAYYIAENFK